MTKKELIFNAGAKLFAERSFNSVGIREIANEAGVNSAMISYYYGGKTGLLREIFISFSSLLLHTIENAIQRANSQHELCAYFTRDVLTNARGNRHIYQVGLRELNHDSEELEDLRPQVSEKCWTIFIQHAERIGVRNAGDDETKDIRFSAVLGLVFSDFLLGGKICMDDDDLAESYIEIITDILQRGLPAHWA